MAQCRAKLSGPITASAPTGLDGLGGLGGLGGLAGLGGLGGAGGAGGAGGMPDLGNMDLGSLLNNPMIAQMMNDPNTMNMCM